MASETHIIQKLRLNIRLPNEKSANQIQSTISEYCRNELVKFLDEKLSNLTDQDTILRIEKLSLDIGDIPLFNLQEELPFRLEEAWQKAWAYHPLAKPTQPKDSSYIINDPVDSQIISTHKVDQNYSLLELFEYFIRWGNLPWWGNLQEYQNWDELILSLLPEQESQIKQLILALELADKPKILARIHQQLSPQTRQKLANISSPQTAKLLTEPLLNSNYTSDSTSQLPDQKPSSKKKLNQALVSPAYQHQHESLEVIQYYFQFGSLPLWSEVKNFEELEGVWLKLMKEQPNKWQEAFQQIIGNEISKRRLFSHLSPNSIEHIVSLYSPNIKQFISAIHSEWELFLSNFSQYTLKHEYAIWIYIFNYLWNQPNKSFSKKELIRSIFEQFSNEQSQAIKKIFDDISSYIKEEHTPILAEFWPDFQADSTLEPREVFSDQTTSQSEAKVEEEQNQKAQKAFDFLVFFFEKGTYPWWGQAYISQSIDQLILDEDTIEQSPEVFKKLMSQLLKSGKAWNRMLIQLQEATLSQILQLLTPQLSGFILTLRQALTRLSDRKNEEGTPHIIFPKSWVWDAIFRPIMEQPSSVQDIYSWSVLILSHLLDGQSFTPDQLLKQLKHISQQAIEKGESRFFPLGDVLRSLIKAKAFEVEESEEESSDLKSEPQIQEEEKGEKEQESSFQSPAQETEQQDKLVPIKSISPVQEETDPKEKVDLDIFFEDALQKKLKALGEIIRLIGDDKIRHLLALPSSNKVFERILKRIQPEKAEIILKYLKGIDDPLLQESNRDQIILSLSQMDEDQIPEPKLEVKPSTPWRSKKSTASEIEGDPIYIGNSGLIILWPYLGRYFDMLDMLEEGTFATPEYAQRAVHLLQYLVTGKTETPEYELALNKILCNLAIDEPVSLGIKMTEREIDISNSLLNGVIQNWEMMSRGTSVDTFRGTFLIRDGKLNEKTDHWHLQVDPAPYDMLLDTMPWGIAIIKLSWMEKLLKVSWR